MRRPNSVLVCPVQALEVGDTIAYDPLVGRIISGTITGKAYTRTDLTEEQLLYMKENDLRLPEGRFEPVAGATAYLLFGDFDNHPNHIFLEQNYMVAVFPERRKK